jgi:sugar lactone lactonase YvrE
MYAQKQSGGNTIWSRVGEYAVSSVVGNTTHNNCVGDANPGYGTDGTSTTSTLYDPSVIAVDSVGNIYIHQNSGEIRIRKMDPQGNVTSLVKGGNPRSGSVITGAWPANNGNAVIYQSRGLCVDKNTDIIYFADYSYHYIRMMLSNSGTPTALSGKAAPTDGTNPYPGGGVTDIISTSANTTRDGNQDNAKFKNPTHCVFDSSKRRLYMGDADLNVRMVDIGYGPNRPSGLSGGGTRVGPSANDRVYVSSLHRLQKQIEGITVDTSGNIFITMESIHSIWKITTPPFGYTMNVNINNLNTGGGTKYLSEYPASLVTVSRFAGNDGSAGNVDSSARDSSRFNKPLGLACDSKNNIYVADSNNNRIRMITPTGSVFTVAGRDGSVENDPNYGNGVNTVAIFNNPISVTIDANDNIYVLDRGSTNSSCPPFSRIRKLQRLSAPSAPTNFTLIYTDSISATFRWDGALTGREPDFPASFYFLVKTAANPNDTRVDINPPIAGSMLSVPNKYITINNLQESQQQGFYINNRISLPLTQNSTYTSIKLVAYNNSGENPSTAITTPVIIKPASTNYTTLKCGKVETPGYANGISLVAQFSNPVSVAVDQSNKVYVTDSGNHCIRVINELGDASLFFGSASAGMRPVAGNTLTALNEPNHIKFSYSGGFPLYVADTRNNRILSINAQGVATLVAITSATPNTLTLESPTCIAIDPAGNLYVTSFLRHCIYRITPQGALSVFGGIAGTSGSRDGPGAADVFNSPTGIVYDPYSTCLYVADTGNHIIRKIVFDAANTVCTLAGTAQRVGLVNAFGSMAKFSNPTDLAVDAEGNVYVTDRSNNCIRKISIAGLVSTFSGGTLGFADGSSTPTAYNAITSTVKYNGPHGMCRNASGQFFITELTNSCIRCISSIPPPTKPTSLTLTTVTQNSATISWSGDTGTTFYGYRINPMTPSVVLPTSTSSPATFTGLLDSTSYSLSLIIGNTAGMVFADPVQCVTEINPSNFVVTVPSTKSIVGIHTLKSVVTATLSWTGVTTANVIQYSINPAQTNGNTTGTFPANQRSPYTIPNLSSGKTYSITLTATINNVPPSTTQNKTSYTVTSSPVNFTTQAPSTAKVFSIAGSGTVSDNTTASATSQTNMLSVPIKDMRGLTLDKNGALFVSSGTCIVKITPPPTSVKNYLFDTSIPNPTPILVTPNPISTTNNSAITLSAGSPTSNGIAGNDSGGNIRFYNISGLSYDRTSDCIYVSDPVMHIVTKLTFATNGTPSITKFAGEAGQGTFAEGSLGANRLKQPKGTAIGPDGSLFIADYGNHKVRRHSGGVLSTISDSTFDGSEPSDVTVWPDGSIFVTCSGHHCIRRLTPNNTTPITYTSSVYAGNSGSSGFEDGSLTDARFNYPQGIASDANYNMYVVDSKNYRVRQITGGNVLTIAGSGEGNNDGNADAAEFKFTGNDTGQNTYAGIHADNIGNIYVTDYRNGKVRLIATSGTTITEEQLENYRASASLGLRESSAKQQQASSALIEGMKAASQAIRASSAQQQVDSSARKVRESSALQQQASSAVQQVASSAQQQVASSAQQQVASSAQRQRDSSAVQQGVSSALQQVASSAQQQVASSAQQQRASSAQQQSVSSAQQQRASSALQQVASSAQQQVASSAQQQTASSAQQQTVSSAQQQSASSALQQRASSAQQQRASSAQQQSASSAQQQLASSAQQQRASSAQQQTASSAQQQRASSAQQQSASSAQQQVASSAQQQTASSARQQTASSAQQQRVSSAQQQVASSAQQQVASSAQQQVASSAQYQSALEGPIALKNTLKVQLAPLRTQVNNIIQIIYSAGGDTPENRAILKQEMSSVQDNQRDLIAVGEVILSIDPRYQDPELQTTIADPTMSSFGIKKVYDMLRNKLIYLDLNNNIVTGIQSGGKGGGVPKNRISRKKSAAKS